MARPTDAFDCLSPVDYRYWDPRVVDFLSENGFTRAKLMVELALITTLHQQGWCEQSVVDEVTVACSQVTTAEVYEEETRTRHDIRALVNCLQAKVSPTTRPYIHMMATSFDISDTANAWRYKRCMKEVVLPTLLELHRVLAQLAIREANTIQIGRTHGQHAVPITFGFAIAEYVSRLGNCLINLKRLTEKLVGKFSGAVGAYNASALFFGNPEQFERAVLANLGLRPASHSTQIAPPEAMERLLNELVLIGGVLANLADDMRHLQRTEIGEVGEAFATDQVGSSTMVQKRNPINFENAKSIWKVMVAQLMVVLLDQLSEHQRDLTNSASARTYGEMVGYLVSVADRLIRTMSKLKVDQENMERNFKLQGDLIMGEPTYILLAAYGHPDAHEALRRVTQRARDTRQTLHAVLEADAELAPYLVQLKPGQRAILADPAKYTGIASRKAVTVAIKWARRLGYELSVP